MPLEDPLKRYINHIGPFEYKGRTIEAHVVKPRAVPAPEGQAGLPPRAFWRIVVGSDQFDGFPAWPDDTEPGVQQRTKRWVDEHLTTHRLVVDELEALRARG